MSSLSSDQCSSFVRAIRSLFRPGLRVFRSIVRRGRQGWPRFPAPASPPQPSACLVTPEVHPDDSVTFRFHAPNAQEVKLAREGTEPIAMHKDDTGVWSVTTAPLPPDYYGYSLIVDGVRILDPYNHLLVPNLLTPANAVHVPGPTSLPWEVNDVPHGVIHHHFYKSAVCDDRRDFYVYTPPSYDPAAKTMYPVLYLLHGFRTDTMSCQAAGFCSRNATRA
jgi:Carbohydrate-binding module 48 (Isoamylase N-terminal domain)